MNKAEYIQARPTRTRTHLYATALKPQDKPYKVSFGGGLLLHIMPNGSKYWRSRFRYNGKEQSLSLGVFPSVTLKEARANLHEARKLVEQGINPNIQKRIQRATNEHAAINTFEQIAIEWLDKEKDNWKATHFKKQLGMLNNNLLPYIGKYPITEISVPVLLDCLKRVEKRGALETTRRSRQVAGQVFKYAIITGRATENPAIHLQGALRPPKTRHYPAIIDPKPFGELLRTIESYHGSQIVESALKFAPLVFVRPGELRHMEWSEIDFEKCEWRIPAEKMKMDKAHIVPLSRQAIALLEEIKPISGRFQYVFPGERSRRRPMSENTLNAALRYLGVSKDEHTTHGFRASARTMLDEELGFGIHLIEHQLAHEVRDVLGRAYNRTQHLPERKEMMQRWADYLDELKAETSKRQMPDLV